MGQIGFLIRFIKRLSFFSAFLDENVGDPRVGCGLVIDSYIKIIGIIRFDRSLYDRSSEFVAFFNK